MFNWVFFPPIHLVVVDIMLTQFRGSVGRVGMFPLCIFHLCHLELGKRYPSFCQLPPIEVYTTFTQKSGTAVSGRRRLTPGGLSASTTGEIMSNCKVIFKEVGAYWRGESVGICQDYLACNICPSVWLVSQYGIWFTLPSLPLFLSPFIPSVTVHDIVLNTAEESGMMMYL